MCVCGCEGETKDKTRGEKYKEKEIDKLRSK